MDTSASGITPRNNVYYRPTEKLRRKLQEAIETEPGAENAVAIIDPYGNLLAIGVDKPTKSPVATSLMNASSDYSRFLFKLISQASDPNETEKYKQSVTYNYLAPTRNSTFIYLKCPSAEQAQTLKDLGAFESSSGGIIQYIEAPRFGTKIDFDQHARALPLYYRSGSSATTPMQSTPEELNIVVWNGNNSGPGSLRKAINAANRANSYRKIVIAGQDPIKLRKPLPLITSPVDIRPAEGNPKAIINFNLTRGLQFSKSASGSSLANLLLKNARFFGVNTDTHWLQFENLSFVASSRKLRGLNFQNVSIKNPLQFKGQNLEGWNNPIAKLTNTFIINDRAIKINANTSLITANRLDTEPEKIEFSFLNQQTQESTTPRVFLGSTIGSLTSAHIEKAFKTGQLKANPHSGSFSVLGDQVVQNLSSGNWLPKAKLADGTELSLTWIEQSGTVINAEFKLLLKTAKDSKPEHLDLISKTYKFSYDVANPGNNIRAQKGELAIKAIRSKSLPITLGFYEVSDPLTGIVKGFSPEQEGYAKVALKRAQKDNLLMRNLPNSGQKNTNQTLLLKNMDPNKNYGILIQYKKEGGNRERFTSYQKPKEGELYPFRSFALSSNRAALGVEVDFRSSKGDFADLVFTLPDNINMIQSGWV